MKQYFDPTLEKANYHSADNCGIHQDKNFMGVRTRPIERRKYKQEKLPSGYISPNGKKTNNKFGFTIGWRGIEEYFKQCKRTESESKKAAQFHTP